MPTFPVDNVWSMTAFVSATLITGLFGYLTIRAKGVSDKKDEDIKPVLEATENLRPVVAELVRQMSVVQEELDKYRPIATIKYPLALNTINIYRYLYPDSQIEIPEQIFDDL